MVGKKQMTLEQHVAFGVAIKQFKASLLDMGIWNAFPKGSRQVAALRRVERSLLVLQSKFDDVVCREYPEHEGLLGIYYGPVDPGEGSL